MNINSSVLRGLLGLVFVVALIGATTAETRFDSGFDDGVVGPVSPGPDLGGFQTFAPLVAVPDVRDEPSPALPRGADLSFLEDAGSWLLTQQQPNGGFPWSPGTTATQANIQAPIGLGLLYAWRRTGNTDFLTAAVEAGDFLFDNPNTFANGSRRFSAADALFFVELSSVSGDPKYREEIDAEYWGPLAAGTYGPDADWNAADYAAAVVGNRLNANIVALAAWDLGFVSVAASRSAQPAIRQQIDDAIVGVLELVDNEGDFPLDLFGLTGAVWAGAIAGEDLNPQAGIWASATTTEGLASLLAGYQLPSGGMPGSTGSTTPVSQATAFSVLGWETLDSATFASNLTSATSFLAVLQQPDGQILNVLGGDPLQAGGVETHAESMAAFALSRLEADLSVAVSTGLVDPVPPLESGWAHFTAELSNDGAGTIENVLLWVEVDGIDDAAKSGVPELRLEYWADGAWVELAWAGSGFHGAIGRDGWFLGRDGSGGVPGFAVGPDFDEAISLRANFPNDLYQAQISVESLDSSFANAASGSVIYFSDSVTLPVQSNPVDVVYVDDAYEGAQPGDTLSFTLPDASTVTVVFGIDAFDDLQSGINAAAADGQVFVRGEHETSGQILIDRNLEIQGADLVDRAVISPASDLPGANSADAWILVSENVDFRLADLILDGGSQLVRQGLRNHGQTSIEGVSFRNIQESQYRGNAVLSFGGIVAGGAGGDSHASPGLAASTLTVTDSDFEQIGRVAILVKGTEATATISDNLFQGKGDGDFLDYAVEIGASGAATITNNEIRDNRGIASADGSVSGGILVSTFFGTSPPSSATISGNTIEDSAIGIALGFGAADSVDVSIAGNTLANNDIQLRTSFDDSGLIDQALADNAFDQAVVVTGVETTIFSTIAQAVDAADVGATVQLATDITEGLVALNKPLSLDGDGFTLTSTSANFGVSIQSVDVEVRNLKVDGAGTFGIHQSPGSDGLTIENTTVQNGGGSGFALNCSDNATLADISAFNNTGTGVSITNSNNVTIDGLTTSGNAFAGGFSAGVGIFSNSATCSPDGTSDVTITDNFSAAEPIPVYEQTTTGSIANVAVPSGLTHATGIGQISLFYQTSLANAVDVAEAFIAGDPALQPLVFARELGGPFQVEDAMSIQAAINAAEDGATIAVAAGSFTENLDLSNRNGLILLGAQAGVGAGVAGPRDAASVTDESIIIGSLGFGGGTPTVADLAIDGFRLEQASLVNNGARINGTLELRNLVVDFTTTYFLISVGTGSGHELVLLDSTLSGQRGFSIGNAQVTQATISGNVFNQSAASLVSASALDGVLDLTGNQFNGPRGLNLLTNNNVISNNVFNVVDVDGQQRGIDLYEVTGNAIEDNVFNTDDAIGILVIAGGRNEAVLDNEITNNQFLGSNASGVVNSIAGKSVDASCNWWGAADGPSGDGSGSGSAVAGEIDFEPWQTSVEGACDGFASPVTRLSDGAIFPSFSDAINDPDTLDGETLTGSAATYEENIVVNKAVTIAGAGPDTVIEGGGAAGNGITIPNGQAGVTIRELRVQNFGGNCIFGALSNHNTTIHDVEVDSCLASGAGGGIYLNGPVDNVSITDSTVTNSTTRGIVIWNGFKTNITISGNTVSGNNCCGIELQDGTASGVTITNNTVTGNGDNGIGVVGLTSGAGPNLIAENTVTDNGRFGIEVKLPDGSTTLDESADGAVVVRDNQVSLNSSVTDLRDLAGIAVFRRGWVAGANNVDIPTGVIVRNNTVSGYRQDNAASFSDGFGIVVEGTNIRVFDNTVDDNDVGIQRQSGHLPYTPNTNVDGDQGNLDDDYFGRGNSPVVCALVADNLFSGNSIDQRDVAQAGAPDPSGQVVNVSTDQFFCSIQDAIDAADTEAGHVIEVGAATFEETVLVNKSITLQGDPSGADRPVITFGSVPAESSLIRVQAQDVVIDGFDLIVDQSFIGEGIRSVGNAAGLVIRNNRISAEPSDPSALVPFGVRNAIGLNLSVRPDSVGSGFGPVTIENNDIVANPAGVGIAGFFRAGVAMDTVHGTLTGNDIQSFSHDAIIRFVLGGEIVVDDNTFRGGGLQFNEFNPTAPALISNNRFLPDADLVQALAGGQSSLRLQNNPNSIATTVSDNEFTGHTTAVRAENYPALAITGNQFAPATGLAYQHLVVSNRVNASNYIAPLEVDIAVDGNDFLGGVEPGTAIVFDNLNCCESVGSGSTTASFGDLRLGGTAPNIFDGSLAQYIVLDDTDGLVDFGLAESEAQPFFTDVDAQGNIWDGVAGADQTAAQRQATRDRIVDRFVNNDLGEVILEGQDSLTVELVGLAAGYAPGDSQTGDELARFSHDDVAGSIDQIFNVFTILDASGNPISAAQYDELFVSFTTDPADYIRSLSGTTVANVVAPDSIDVSLLFELQPDAPFGEYELVLTSFDVTGVVPTEVNLGDALAGEYFVLDSASQFISVRPDTVFVDDDFAGLSAGDPVVFDHPELGAPVNATFGIDAFATVPAGLGAVNNGGLVLVAEGQYPGGNLMLDGSQRLIGAGADVTVLGAEEGGWPSGQLGDVIVGSDNVEIASLQIHGYDSFRIDTAVGGVENIVIRDNRLRKGNQHGIVVDGRNWRITENVIEDAGQVLPHLGILGGFLDFAEDILVRGNTIRGSAATGVFIQGGPGIVLLNNDIEDNGGFGAASSAQAFMGYNRARSVPNPAIDVRTGDSVVLCNQVLANADGSASEVRATDSDAFVSLNALFDSASIANTGAGQLDATENWWEAGPLTDGDVLVDPELDAFDDYLSLCFPTPELNFSAPSVQPGGTVALTVSVEKPVAIASGGFDIGLEGVVFDVPLPAEFDVALVNDGCGTASLVANVLMVTDAALPAGTDGCEIELSISTLDTGTYEVFSSEFFSLETGLGGVPGSATLQVESAAIELDGFDSSTLTVAFETDVEATGLAGDASAWNGLSPSQIADAIAAAGDPVAAKQLFLDSFFEISISIGGVPTVVPAVALDDFGADWSAIIIDGTDTPAALTVEFQAGVIDLDFSLDQGNTGATRIDVAWTGTDNFQTGFGQPLAGPEPADNPFKVEFDVAYDLATGPAYGPATATFIDRSTPLQRPFATGIQFGATSIDPVAIDFPADTTATVSFNGGTDEPYAPGEVLAAAGDYVVLVTNNGNPGIVPGAQTAVAFTIEQATVSLAGLGSDTLTANFSQPVVTPAGDGPADIAALAVDVASKQALLDEFFEIRLSIGGVPTQVPAAALDDFGTDWSKVLFAGTSDSLSVTFEAGVIDLDFSLDQGNTGSSRIDVEWIGTSAFVTESGGQPLAGPDAADNPFKIEFDVAYDLASGPAYGPATATFIDRTTPLQRPFATGIQFGETTTDPVAIEFPADTIATVSLNGGSDEPYASGELLTAAGDYVVLVTNNGNPGIVAGAQTAVAFTIELATVTLDGLETSTLTANFSEQVVSTAAGYDGLTPAQIAATAVDPASKETFLLTFFDFDPAELGLISNWTAVQIDGTDTELSVTFNPGLFDKSFALDQGNTGASRIDAAWDGTDLFETLSGQPLEGPVESAFKLEFTVPYSDTTGVDYTAAVTTTFIDAVKPIIRPFAPGIESGTATTDPVAINFATGSYSTGLVAEYSLDGGTAVAYTSGEELVQAGAYELTVTNVSNPNVEPGASTTIRFTIEAELAISIDGPTPVPVVDEQFYEVRLQNTLATEPSENVIGQVIVARAAGIDVADLVVDFCADSEAAGTPENCADWLPLNLVEDGGELTATFGPGAGFPVPVGYDATTFFRVSFLTAGNYDVSVNALGVDSDGVLASDSIGIAATELAFDIVAGTSGVPTPDEGNGWAYYTATLINQGDALPENVLLWVEVDGIDQAEFDAGAALQYYNPVTESWTDFGWGMHADIDPSNQREAFFLGRDGMGSVTGFPVGDNEDFPTAIRVNFDNAIYDLTVSVETADQAAQTFIYGLFDEQIAVISLDVNLSFELDRGVAAPVQPPRWDYFTATLSNTDGGATPDNIVLFVEVDVTDFPAGDRLQFWNGSDWQDFGWDAGRQAWFLGRDGAGGVSGFPIEADEVFPIELRVNFLPGDYDFTVSVESIDDDITGVGGVYALFAESVEVLPTPATITFVAADLVQTFDGNVKTVGVTTGPEADLPVDISFDPEPPINAGSYVVQAVITDPYFDGSATTSLLIEKGQAEVILSDLSQVFDGAPKPVTVETVPAGLSINVTYDGLTDAPIPVGSYSVFASVDDPNWAGSAAGLLQITPATADVTLVGLEQTFDGSPRVVMADTDPAGLTVEITYDGSPVAPVDAGSYAIEATVNDANFMGSAVGTLIVDPATADVQLSDLVQVFDGLPKPVTVITDPIGLAVEVSYDGDPAAPTPAGDYAVTATVVDPNYVGSASDTLVIEQGDQTIDFPMLMDRTADDSPFTLTATASSGLAVSFEVVSGPATVDGDEVTLTGGLGEVVIEAQQDGDSDWNAAVPVQQAFQVTAGQAVAIEAISATSISGVAGQPIAAADLPTVRAIDANENPVPGVTVGFAITGGSGSISGSVAETDSDGLAQLTSWTLGGENVQTLEASAPSVAADPVVFTATVGGAADVTVQITDNRETIEVGTRNTYVVTIGNLGPSAVPEAEVSVPLPAELDPATAEWVCFPGNGASCASEGTGAISDTVSLPEGGSLVYILEADVRVFDERLLVVTASVDLGAITPVDPSTLIDSDETFIEIAEDSLFRDRFEADSLNGGHSMRGQIQGFLTLPASIESLGKSALLVTGFDAGGRQNLRVVLVQSDDQRWIRASVRGESDLWEHSDWQSSALQDRLLAFEFNAGLGSVILAGEALEVISTQTRQAVLPIGRLETHRSVRFEADSM